MKPYNFFAVLCTLLTIITNTIPAQSNLTITEVMFRPLETNGEFIEIFNLSETDSIDLTGYKIIYQTSAADPVIAHTNGIKLAPQTFTVILEGDYDFVNGSYMNLIPEKALLIKINNNAFGASGMANTSDRTIYLLNAANDTLDVYTYTANNADGISDEKILINTDNTPGNWANSLLQHGTPGTENSVSPKNFDLAVTSLSFAPEQVFEGGDITVTAVIKNFGLQSADVFSVDLYDDLNNDSLGTIDELLFSNNYQDLASGDSLSIDILIENVELRLYNLIVEIIFANDQMNENDKSFISFNVSEKPVEFNSLVINEIMYAPSGGEPEWVEIYNTTDKKINLSNWKFSDLTSTALITDTSFLLAANEYLVLSVSNSINNYYDHTIPLITFSLPSLNNSGDGLKLIDNYNRVIDSVNYKSGWGGNSGGRSLERKDAFNNSNDSTNWATAISPDRATPGMVNSVVPKDFDLVITELTITPGQIFEGDDISLDVKIKNPGTQPADLFSIYVFDDLNNDSTGSPGEQIYSQDFQNITAGDSLTTSLIIENVQLKIYNLIVEVDFTQDQVAGNNILFISFDVYPQPVDFGGIIINEIMYDPQNGEPEWIEIFNNSNREIDLINWRFADLSSNPRISTASSLIQPGEYLILTDDSSLTNYYPDEFRFITFNLPSLNNSGDGLRLIDNYNRLIDSVYYLSSWSGNVRGRSLERIDPEAPGNESTNWSASISPQHATPGEKNSVFPRDFDLAVNSFTTNSYGIVGSVLNSELEIVNPGQQNVSSFNINFFKDENNDSTPQPNELIETMNVTPIIPLSTNDSLIVRYELQSFDEGFNRFIAEVELNDDEFTGNNFASVEFTGVVLNETRRDLIINEFNYAPVSPEPEWIEVFNRSNKTININGYQVADNADTVKVIGQNFFIEPGEFFVLAKDSTFIDLYTPGFNLFISSFPTLNNTTDKIILLDSLGRTIDSLQYKSTWGGSNGRSLERIEPQKSSTDSTNWGTASLTIGGTPGKVNSISIKDFDAALTKLFFTPGQPQYGSSVSISAQVKNLGKESIEFSLMLYDDIDLDSTANTLVEQTITLSLNPGDSLVHVFSYSILNLTHEIGFICEIDFAKDENTANNYYYKSIAPGYPPGTLIINEIMYTPQNGEPEWVEFFNNSDVEINLKDWSLTDVLTTPVKKIIATGDVIVYPYSFVVVSKDSAIYQFHSSINSQVIISAFANLNNDKDGVVLKDRFDTTIDSVYYESPLGGTNGYSLERISFDEPSTGKSNWASSIDIEQSTPGRVNSVRKKSYDLAITKIEITPQFPLEDDLISLITWIKNFGEQPAENFSLILYLTRKGTKELLYDFSNLSMQPSDSSGHGVSNAFVLIDTTIITAEIIFELDEDTSNNFAVYTLIPGYEKNSIIITEFMFNPLGGASEWIEFYNNSSKPISLTNWKVSDLLSSPTKNVISDTTAIVNPAEYFVITNSREHFTNYFDAKLFVVNFGTLGNTEDGIVIYDFRDAVIDSLRYDNKWSSVSGRSMERLYFDSLTTNADNWTASISECLGTPGIANSNTTIPSYEFNNVVINEIMFAPQPDNSEFIELVNISDIPINIGGWLLIDEAGNTNRFSNVSHELFPNEYFVLAADSSILFNYDFPGNKNNITILGKSDLGLSNSGEIIFITDLRGNIIDSLTYNNNWHNKNFTFTTNRSLERINPHIESNNASNWSTSVDTEGATPLKQNSIYTAKGVTKSKMDISPNPFSPDNDGFEDFTIISYNLKESTAQIRIKIFDDRGRLERTLANNRASGSAGSIIFDGLDDNGKAMRIGMYIVFLEALNSSSGVLETIKKVVVVARKL